MNEVWITAAGLGLSSIFGSAIGLLIKKIPHKWSDTFLGFCAGMMLAAAIVCLLMPAIESLTPSSWWMVALGVAAGVLLVGILDRITPHIHSITGLEEPESHVSAKSMNRTLLFVMAIAIHKLPEGLATGVSLNGNPTDAFALALTIAVQNIPEGMVIVTPLIMVGIRFIPTFLIAFCVAVLETAGVFFGYWLGDLSSQLLPFMLALAGGAMLYVISDEMIPETHSHGFQKQATFALVAGVVAMLMIESLF